MHLAPCDEAAGARETRFIVESTGVVHKVASVPLNCLAEIRHFDRFWSERTAKRSTRRAQLVVTMMPTLVLFRLSKQSACTGVDSAG